MDPETNKKSQTLWLSAFSLIPAAAAIIAYAGKLPGGTGSLVSGLMPGLAGIVLGLSGYMLMRRRSHWAKGAVLAGLAGLLFIGAALLPGSSGAASKPDPVAATQAPELADSLRTCPVCGYRSISPDTLLCPVCSVELTEAERINWEYGSLDEMLREEQAMFFAAEGYRDSVSFYEPAIWESEGIAYRKDSTWQPVIDKRRVLMMRDTLIRAGVIEAPAEQ